MMIIVNYLAIATVLNYAGLCRSTDHKMVLDLIFLMRDLLARIDTCSANAQEAKESLDVTNWHSDYAMWRRQEDVTRAKLWKAVQRLNAVSYKWGQLDDLPTEENMEIWASRLVSTVLPDGDCSYAELEERIWDEATRP